MDHKLVLGLVIGTLTLSAGCYGTDGGSDGGSGGMGSASGGTTSGGKGGTTGIAGSGTSGGTGGYSSGGYSSGGTSVGGSSAYECAGDSSVAATVDKSCTTVGDCVLVNHTSSCCGDGLIMAINSSEQARFASAESYCSALLPACGCAAQGVSAEDGTMVQFGSESLIAAQCTEGLCNSYYTGGTFPCADTACTQEQYCTITTGGPAGATPSGACYFDGGCSDCTCVGSAGCQCSVQDGNVTVSCAAP